MGKQLMCLTIVQSLQVAFEGANCVLFCSACLVVELAVSLEGSLYHIRRRFCLVLLLFFDNGIAG